MGAVFLILVIMMSSYLQNADSKIIPCNGYVCGDGSCVNGTRCDGITDCADGSDELRCERQSTYCSSSQYRCPSTYYSSSRCIPSSYRCDGDRDCSDGSDEQNCQSTSSCHYCYSTSSYLSYYGSYICSTPCDDNTECSDGSDEQYCSSDSSSSALIGIIVGSTIGGLLILIGCPTTIIIIVACVVYHSSRRTAVEITTTPVGGDTSTIPANQPGFQMQNLSFEKSPVQTTQQAPPPYVGK